MWFTIQWDRAEPAADTVEANPASLFVNGAMQTLQIRVSRAAPLTNGDGLPNRSYNAEVLLDCFAKTAKYTTME